MNSSDKCETVLTENEQIFAMNRLSDDLNIIDIKSREFDALDDRETWLMSSTNNDNRNSISIIDWINNAFVKEKANGSHKVLSNKLDELKLLSSHSIDTRTFTRPKRNSNKRESLFNGNALSTLYSPDESESSPETTNNDINQTFDVKSAKTFNAVNNTFILDAENTGVNSINSTFTICNEEMNNIDDVEKIAKLQEENLLQSCFNGSSHSRQNSPICNVMPSNISTSREQMHYQPNNTLTKNRDFLKHSNISNILLDDIYLNSHSNATEDDYDESYYQNGYSPDSESFLSSQMPIRESTPLVAQTKNSLKTNRYVNFSQESSIATKIMPNVSNLKSQSSYGYSKIGRSEPNISKRLQLVPAMNNGLSNKHSKSNQYGIKPMQSNNGKNNNTNTNLIQGKMPSDSKLVERTNAIRQPLYHKPPQTQTQTLGRITSPPPSHNQTQQLLGKVLVEPNKMGSTNLSRKSTFRVRDYPSNEENSRESSVNCLTNSNPSINGYQTNITVINNAKQLQKNMSKIPGPKPLRSGIPVSGPRTAIPAPNNNRQTNFTDNSWKNGCY